MAKTYECEICGKTAEFQINVYEAITIITPGVGQWGFFAEKDYGETFYLCEKCEYEAKIEKAGGPDICIIPVGDIEDCNVEDEED